MTAVLFVCLGNICRSPSAHAVFRALVASEGLEEKISTDSAGTAAWHTGNRADDRARSVGRLLGYDMDDLRARQVTVQDFGSFDYIIAMDQNNLRDLQALAPASYTGHLSLMLDFSGKESGEVPDPYYGDISDYEHVFELLEPAATGLLTHIRRGSNL